MTKRNILAEADKFLVKSEVTELPLTMETLRKIAVRSNWLLSSYQHSEKILEATGTSEKAKHFPAFTIRWDGKVIILYDEELPYDLKVQFICHEFGHIVLNHTSDRAIIGASRDASTTDMQEREADDFATEMLAPACVMNKLGISSVNELLKAGLLTTDQALEHFENVKSGAPVTETQKLLCDRINFNQPKRHNFSWLKYVACFAAGFVICGALLSIKNNNLLPVVPDDYNSSSESPSETQEPGESTVTTTATSSSTSSTTVPVSSAASTSASTTPAQDDPQSEVVYVTPHGTKYHKPDCYHIEGRADIVGMTISEAEANGYEPCKHCF